MRTSALELLACPRCGGAFIADSQRQAPDGHIMSGALLSACGARYRIEDGIPRLAGDAESPTDRLGPEWHIFDPGSIHLEQRFLDFIAPLQPRDFAERNVLEVGCGRGHHTRLMARYGARAVVAVDRGAAADRTFSATRHLRNVHVVDGDLSEPPVQRAFDIGLALGVLHFLRSPAAAFRALHDRIVAGGRLAIWVYGYEHNEWLARVVDPLRRHLTSRLAPELVYWLTLPPALGLAAILRLYRLRTLAKRLPYGPFFHYIADYPVREVHGLVFEQLRTPVEHYIDQHTVQSWLGSPHLTEAALHWHFESSWRATATVAGHAQTNRVAG